MFLEGYDLSEQGSVKLKLAALLDPQHSGFATGGSQVS